MAAGSPILRRPDKLRAEASKRLAEEHRRARYERDAKADRAGSKRTDVRLTHYGRTKGLKELDPAYHGQGLRGAESKRKEADSDHIIMTSRFAV